MYRRKHNPNLLLIAIVMLLIGSLACNLSNLQRQDSYDGPPSAEEEPFEGQPPEDEPMPEEGEPEHEGEPPSEEEHPEEVFIEFEADRTHLAPGECTMLFWHVEGGFGVFLNGEEVERGGDREVCLNETEPFFLAVDLGEEMDERVIEIFVEGDPGHEEEPSPEEDHPPEGEQPEGEPPPENEPPPEEEQPPEEPQMNDEEAIRQALLSYLGWTESELEFTMGEHLGDVANGGVKKVGDMSGAAWFAGKNPSGQWKIAFVGQGLPYCSEIQSFNFPPHWISHCLDASGNTVER